MKFFKKINISLTIKTIIIVFNVITLFFIYSFYEKNVYSSIVADNDYILEQSRQNTNNINIKKFNSTLEKLSQKQKTKINSTIVNFFTSK